jgi:transcriptional regulator with XRE-family HTH domain
MATVDATCDGTPTDGPNRPSAVPATNAQPPAAPSPTVQQPPQLHRLQSVRLQQNISLRTVARQTGTDVRQLRLQEKESCDIRLSDLHKWQQVLEVPLVELIVEPESRLSNPVMERAQMIRLMKTAAAILELADSPRIGRMAQMLVEQLVEVMPELKDVGPWHSYGQRRGTSEFGRVMEQPFSLDPGSWDEDD